MEARYSNFGAARKKSEPKLGCALQRTPPTTPLFSESTSSSTPCLPPTTPPAVRRRPRPRHPTSCPPATPSSPTDLLLPMLVSFSCHTQRSIPFSVSDDGKQPTVLAAYLMKLLPFVRINNLADEDALPAKPDVYGMLQFIVTEMKKCCVLEIALMKGFDVFSYDPACTNEQFSC